MPTWSPGPDALGGQEVGQSVGPLLHLGVGAALARGHQVLPVPEGVDGGLEHVGQVEGSHRADSRTGFCSATSSEPAQPARPRPAGRRSGTSQVDDRRSSGRGLSRRGPVGRPRSPAGGPVDRAAQLGRGAAARPGSPAPCGPCRPRRGPAGPGSGPGRPWARKAAGHAPVNDRGAGPERQRAPGGRRPGTSRPRRGGPRPRR